MALPEHFQERFIGCLLRIKHDEHHFRMTGFAAADFFVGCIRCEAAGVAYRCGVNPRQFPEHTLNAPETAHGKNRLLQTLGKGAFQRVTQHAVGCGYG